MTQDPKKIMVTSLNENPGVDPRALAYVAQKAGRSALSVVFEMAKFRLNGARIRPNEYLGYGLWRKDLTPAQKAGFLSLEKNKLINRDLASPSVDQHGRLFSDKFLSGTVLASIGLTVPQNKAVFSTETGFGALLVLRDVATLTAHMLDAANLPFFGKPVSSSRALGAISVIALAGEGRVRLGDGREVEARALAEEVAREFPRGWFLQELVNSSAAVRALTGPALSTLRIVTLWGTSAAPQPFYAVWRMAAKGAMNDSAGAGTNTVCDMDMVTGQIKRAHHGDYLTGRDITHSAVDPTRQLVGFVVPGWPAILQQLCDAHQCFPGHGILGWDVAITENGPLVTEVNTSPLHMLFQRARDEPFLTPPILALLQDVRTGIRARFDRTTKGKKAWVKPK
jgi:hypothetical protein